MCERKCGRKTLEVCRRDKSGAEGPNRVSEMARGMEAKETLMLG